MLVKNLLNVEESISSSWVSFGSYAFRFFCFSFIFSFLATEEEKSHLEFAVIMYGRNQTITSHRLDSYLSFIGLNLTHSQAQTIYVAFLLPLISSVIYVFFVCGYENIQDNIKR